MNADLGESGSVPGFLEQSDTKEAHEGMAIEIEIDADAVVGVLPEALPEARSSLHL